MGGSDFSRHWAAKAAPTAKIASKPTHFDRHPAIILGSVKATVGHTGWLAGAASVIKLCKSMEQNLIPAQHLWTRPNDNIDLANSPFSISATAQPWLPNTDGQPRRAGVDGFGFGGTNAHLIVDQYLPAYHDRLSARPVTPPTATALAIECRRWSGSQLLQS